jgi:ADP-heptose:LPS heptosyltransferase
MKVLLLELWGLGDAVFLTTALQPLLEAQATVTVLAKPASIELLRPSYPGVTFVPFDAPWTVFRGKYRLWRWPWGAIMRMLWALRRERFDAAASVRDDPRDHVLMRLAGARRRIGFPRRGSGMLLSQPLRAERRPHRVEAWRQIARALLERSRRDATMLGARPFLRAGAYGDSAAGGKKGKKPVVGLHAGARIAVRRWDEASFAEIIRQLRAEADFHLVLFPDPDGYGRGLAPLADACREGLSVTELAAELGACDVVIGNDSGPGHIAAALGVPVLAIFGPTDPDRYRPFGAENHVVIRDICAFRPCYDYCRFPHPICLKELTPAAAWPEIRDWFLRHLDSGAGRRLA